MATILPNTTTTARLQDTVLGGAGGQLFARGAVLVANNPAQIEVTTAFEYGQERTTLYPYITPTVFPLVSGTPSLATQGRVERITQVRIADAITGSHAQVSGWLIEPGLAGPDIGAIFTSQVAASGGITPGLSSVQIQKNGTLVGTEPILDLIDSGSFLWSLFDDVPNTRVTVTPPRLLLGRINAAGAAISGSAGGTLWTSVRNSAGNFTITFGANFARVPAVFAMYDGAGAAQGGYTPNTLTLGVGAVTISWTNQAGTPSDPASGFSFQAWDPGP